MVTSKSSRTDKIVPVLFFFNPEYISNPRILNTETLVFLSVKIKVPVFRYELPFRLANYPLKDI